MFTTKIDIPENMFDDIILFTTLLLCHSSLMHFQWTPCLNPRYNILYYNVTDRLNNNNNNNNKTNIYLYLYI